jgi:hypothetical protein
MCLARRGPRERAALARERNARLPIENCRKPLLRAEPDFSYPAAITLLFQFDDEVEWRFPA